MKNLLAKVKILSGDDVGSGSFLADSLTEVLETCLSDSFGLETPDTVMQKVVRQLVESPAGTVIPIEECFDRGYDAMDGEEYTPMEARNAGGHYEIVHGETDEVLEIRVERWVPDVKRKAELEALSKEELVLKLLEMEATRLL